MCNTYKIGIIDDDDSKLETLITRIKIVFETEIKRNYPSVNLEFLRLELQPDINDIVSSIIDNGISCILLDYKLSTNSGYSYNGVLVYKEIDKKIFQLPLFIFTAHADEIYASENIDTYQIINYGRLLEEKEEQIEIITKIIEQIKKYNYQIREWKAEIHSLLSIESRNLVQDERLIELDNYLERSLFSKSMLSPTLKTEITEKKFLSLVSSIEELLKR